MILLLCTDCYKISNLGAWPIREKLNLEEYLCNFGNGARNPTTLNLNSVPRGWYVVFQFEFTNNEIKILIGSI